MGFKHTGLFPEQAINWDYMIDKIKEMIISAIIKKGMLYEGRNCDINIDVPNGNETIKINFKADNMSLRIEKSNE